MRSQLRTGLIAGVVVGLVLTLPTLVAASPASARPGGDRGVGHARAAAVLAEVRAALTGEAPRAGHARDLTLLLRDLRAARSALTPSERALADSYLARPSLSSACTGTVVVSGSFCVHYKTGLLAGADASTPEWAQLTADTLSYVWTREVDALGFRAPPPDDDQYFDVYLEDVGSQGLYGYCAPDVAQPHSSSYCVLDNDFDPAQYGGAPAVNSLRVTAAHEFFHAIQFGYDVFEDIWLMEGSATWAEEQVYPAVNDYLQYLGHSAVAQPRVPADYSGASGPDIFYRYGAVVFWKFLSEQFGSPAVVRRVWEYADGSRYSLQAVTAALAERGWTFSSAFARFGAWNTLPPGTYGDRLLFPRPPLWRSERLSRGNRSTGSRAIVLDHLTNATMLVRPAKRLPKRTRLRIDVSGPARVRMPAATVQIRRRNGSVRFLAVPLDSAGDGRRTVGFNPRKVSSVVVTLTNASTRMAGCGTDGSDRFSCSGYGADDGQAYGVRARLRLG